MKNKLCYFVVLSFLFSNVQVQAGQCETAGSAKDGCVTPTGIPPVATGNGVADSASEAEKQNSKGSSFGMMGVTAGGVAVATSGCPGATCRVPQFALGIAAIAAGMLLQKTHNKAGAGAGNTRLQVTDPYATPYTADSWGSEQPGYEEMKKTVEGLKARGVKVDMGDGRIGLPNGKTISAVDAQNAEKLGGAVGKSIDQAALNSGLSGLMDAAKNKAELLAKEKGGGEPNKVPVEDEILGGGSSNSIAGPGYDGAAKANANQASSSGSRAPASVAGMKKQYGDSFIGVAGDDIFGMMNRRYELKGNQNTFLLKTESLKK